MFRHARKFHWRCRNTYLNSRLYVGKCTVDWTAYTLSYSCTSRRNTLLCKCNCKTVARKLTYSFRYYCKRYCTRHNTFLDMVFVRKALSTTLRILSYSGIYRRSTPQCNDIDRRVNWDLNCIFRHSCTLHYRCRNKYLHIVCFQIHYKI